ncbi:hypothetical protein [Streptomyces bobili]|uniref:hypothetical protein n=1 Tax=Streptomyces bobili TaxID=67280 RepID=UPI0037B307E8
MDKTTQAQAPTDRPAPAAGVVPTAYGWCSWHQGSAENVRLIYAHEQGSGPGGGTFACEPCREENKLVPFADQP